MTDDEYMDTLNKLIGQMETHLADLMSVGNNLRDSAKIDDTSKTLDLLYQERSLANATFPQKEV